MITVGSLFSGIGGLDLGLERAGMTVRWQVEIDPYCRRVLAKHWPDVERYEDVRDVGRHNLESVDLVCGGFPCQPVSTAGQRKGTDDERWLWPEFARVVRELRPRWVLAENVPGLLSVDAGRLFGGVLRDLAACGYDAEWDCIPACAVGAPHRRDRVFIVGNSKHNGSRNTENRRTELQSPESSRANTIRKLTRTDHVSENVADHDMPGLADVQGQRAATRSHGTTFAGADHRRPDGQWSPEPDVGRVATRISGDVDRLRGLGNAVVPQVAEWIGRRITER